jgi:hypothetical protein
MALVGCIRWKERGQYNQLRYKDKGHSKVDQQIIQNLAQHCQHWHHSHCVVSVQMCKSNGKVSEALKINTLLQDQMCGIQRESRAI